MGASGSAFVRRALLFLERARAGRYPNARWLAEQEEISVPTARRVVNRLRDDFGAPLHYSDADRGWELTSKDWRFAGAALPSRRELVALAFALDVGQAVSDAGLEEALETFRLRLAERLGTTRPGVDAILDSFSSDRTDRSLFADPLVIDVIEATAQHRVLRFDYASPWKSAPSTQRAVEPLHVRCIDGAAYLLAATPEGERVFNLSFVDNITVTDEPFTPPPDTHERDWSESFGVWTGDDVVEVSVRIAAPAARYFAGQQWHPAQHDHWHGDVLERRFPGHLSPEIVRRLLGLGDALLAVGPAELRDAVTTAARTLLANLDREGPGEGSC